MSTPYPLPAVRAALQAAIAAARELEGATAPNPPVGAAAIDVHGELLVVGAHVRAGTPHAEQVVLNALRERGLADRLHTMVVTLEPCNHHGRTPPCAEALIEAGAKAVFFGAHDPNPKASGGKQRLLEAGIPATLIDDPGLRTACTRLNEPFVQWVLTGMPWVTVKRAFTHAGSMIPPAGQTTFTTPDSLRFAHELRKRSDAILTGVGTILADRPEFTVRHVPDHSGKQRLVIVADRHGRTPADWIKAAESRGFQVLLTSDWQESLREAGRRGAHRVLVEAGPALSEAVLRTSLWNENVLITRNLDNTDRIETLRRLP